MHELVHGGHHDELLVLLAGDVSEATDWLNTGARDGRQLLASGPSR